MLTLHSIGVAGAVGSVTVEGWRRKRRQRRLLVRAALALVGELVRDRFQFVVYLKL